MALLISGESHGSSSYFSSQLNRARVTYQSKIGVETFDPKGLLVKENNSTSTADLAKTT